MLWTFRPRLWDGPGAGAPAGGVSRWGDVSGVVGWEDGPPASRARRLRRICTREIKQQQINVFVCTSGRAHAPRCPLAPRHGGVFAPAKPQISNLYFLTCYTSRILLPFLCSKVLKYPWRTDFKDVFAAMESHLHWRIPCLSLERLCKTSLTFTAQEFQNL